MKKIHIKLMALLTLSISTGVTVAEEDIYAEIRGQLETCFTCHGENGVGHPDQPLTPILAGQESYYLYVQLKDFKSGLRGNPIMSPIASGLEKEQMKLIGKFFSEQQWPETTFEASPEQIAAGKSGVVAGQCVACHLGAFNGNSRVPRLAGQKAGYLQKTMTDFKTKDRNNDASVSAVFTSFSDETISGLADYLAGFKN